MAYSKTIWVNGETAAGATNMNKIENELEALDTGKQDNLTAGTNITIDQNNVISATGIDEIVVLYNDTTGTNGNITFSSSITSANNIEIIYCRRRVSTGTSVFKSTGKLPYSSGMEIALDINFYSQDTNQQSIAKIVTASSSGLTVNGENTMQQSGGQVVTGATTNIYITKVIIYK